MMKLRLVYNTLFLLLCFTVPFENQIRAVPNLILLALCLLFPFVNKGVGFKNLNKKLFVTFIALCIYALIISLLNYSSEELNLLRKIILIPLIIFLAIPITNSKFISYGLLAGTASLILLSLFSLFTFYLEYGHLNFTDGFEINDYILTERLYLGMYSLFSYFISLQLLFKSTNKKLKIFLILNLILCAFCVLIISARLATVLIIGFSGIIFISRLKPKQYLPLLIIGSLLIITFFKFNPNLTQRFFYASDINESSYIEKIKEWEPRVVIWDCSIDVLKNSSNIITGQGIIKTKKGLLNCYENSIEKRSKRNYFLTMEFNSHNQFLDILLSYGVIGCMLFLTFFALLFKKIKKSQINLIIFSSIIFFCLIENVFYRQIGVYLFSIVIIYLVNKEDSISANSTTHVSKN